MTKLPMPFNNPTTYPGHGGMDYGKPSGTPVLAEGPGVIDWSGFYSERGGFAKFITFDNGERRGYYHFDKEGGLKKGDRVEYGTEFAYVGELGLYSTGPHLHHEVWQNGAIIKPPQYWDHVDRNHYVGDGSASGGGSSEFVPPLIIEDDAMSPIWNVVKKVGDKPESGELFYGDQAGRIEKLVGYSRELVAVAFFGSLDGKDHAERIPNVAINGGDWDRVQKLYKALVKR